MRKYVLLSSLIVAYTFICFSPMVLATPKTMSDGQIFDAAYYAEQYPDVRAAYGNDEGKLYEHYLIFGKNEGRHPFATSDSGTVTASNDLVIGNIDETAEKQAEMQKGYTDLPQNVKNYYNSKPVRIYAATKDHIGTVNTRKSIGCSLLRWNNSGELISADVYVCGSSFMPPRYTLYHELGHVLDYNGRYSSNWSGWTEMQPYSPMQVYSAGEAFAEAFAGYFERPQKLKSTAPNAYSYIENIIVGM